MHSILIEVCSIRISRITPRRGFLQNYPWVWMLYRKYTYLSCRSPKCRTCLLLSWDNNERTNKTKASIHKKQEYIYKGFLLKRMEKIERDREIVYLRRSILHVQHRRRLVFISIILRHRLCAVISTFRDRAYRHCCDNDGKDDFHQYWRVVSSFCHTRLTRYRIIGNSSCIWHDIIIMWRGFSRLIDILNMSEILQYPCGLLNRWEHVSLFLAATMIWRVTLI